MNKIKTPTTTRIFLMVGLAMATFVVLATVYAQSGNTVQGCFDNKTGALRKVNAASDCGVKETPISWSITGPQGLQGIQGVPGPQGPSGPGALRVVDSLNKEVGRYENRAAILYVASINRWLSLVVSQNGFSQSGLSFYYQSTDCSGPAQPAVDHGNDVSNLVSFAFLDNDLVYYSTGSAQLFSWNSQKSPEGACFSNVNSGNVTPFATFPVSDLGVTPPFHLAQ
ncbi:MAG: hypothetical protein H7Z16_09200 [Pyrinomonadaceae bacterium]|nr:hypothetical protein [Pyrinomonadaceae bacterium]